MSVKKYLNTLGSSLSIALNAILGGEPYQSFSARQYYWNLLGYPNLEKFVDKLFGEPGHCYKGYVNWKVATAAIEREGYKRTKVTEILTDMLS